MPKPGIMQAAIKNLKSEWRSGKSLKEIAHHHRVDAGNLERAFRKQEGMTVKQFLDAKRKEHVLARLADKKFLGYAIGAELGFGNDLAFYRWVKRAFGVSFAELRARNSANQKPRRSAKIIKE
ncbi:helix-turn-helix transcriptional regulator [candidate division KSB1 bacterium]|nr:helix-turn-helix transcriptional regulator [candidate division KSB1 bacterium]